MAQVVWTSDKEKKKACENIKTDIKKQVSSYIYVPVRMCVMYMFVYMCVCVCAYLRDVHV